MPAMVLFARYSRLQGRSGWIEFLWSSRILKSCLKHWPTGQFDGRESMRLRTFVVLAAAFLILASGGVVWSQTVQGVITGTITDPTGAVVPGATVTITNVGTNFSQSTTTGSD